MQTSRLLIFVFFFCSQITLTYSQVGINTVSPNALLEIQASSQTNPTATDGILIPKVDEFPTTNPTINQDGMLLFVTGAGSANKGFYLWDNTSASWKSLEGALEKIDEGNGVGWRLRGKNPAFYNTIGLEAVDVSINNTTTTTSGASGYASFASGFRTSASGNYSFSGGHQSEATNFAATAVGNFSEAAGYASFAAGNNNSAIGNNSFVGGNQSTTLGGNSIGLGNNVRTVGISSVAMGEGTVAVSNNEMVVGKFNRLDPFPNQGCDYVFQIGYGTGAGTLQRKTALTVDANGATKVKELQSSGTIKGDIENAMLLDLRDGWSHYGGDYQRGSFYKDNERVYIEGLVRRNLPINPNTLIAILPPGYRPQRRLIFNVGQNGEAGAMIRVDVLPNGRVRFMTPYLSVLHPDNYVSLSGISFRAYVPPQIPIPGDTCPNIVN